MTPTTLLVGFAALLAAGLAAYLRPLLRERRAKACGPSPFDGIVEDRSLAPAQVAALHALTALQRPAERPVYASADTFDRCASERLVEILNRGGDARGEGEHLHLLRKALGFPEASGEIPSPLEPVSLVQPSGERSDGIVLSRQSDELAVLGREIQASVRPGLHLTVQRSGQKTVEDRVAIVLSVQDYGNLRLVRLDASGLKGKRRRAHFRLATRLLASARIGVDRPFETAIVLDIAHDGVRLQYRPSEASPATGEPAFLRILVGDAVVDVKGSVVWAARAPSIGESAETWTVGVRLDEFREEDRARILERVLSQAAGSGGRAPVPTVRPDAVT